MSDAIDAMVDSATAKPDANTTEVKTEVKTEVDANAETSEGQQPAVKKDDPWPKTAVNAVSRRDRKIAQRDARNAELQRQNEELMKKVSRYEPKPEVQADPNDPEPDLTKYDDWAKYNRDLTLWNVRQNDKSKQAEEKTKQPQAQYTPEQVQWIKTRADYATQKGEELMKSYPEFAQAIEQNIEAIADLPEQMRIELIKCDEPALATLVLIQDGTLDDLADMAPRLAAKTIAAAAERGKKLIGSAAGAAQANQSQAPAPLSKPRAPSVSQKSGNDLPETEFRKRYLS